ncbi:ribosome-associated translation inhibitor RaiA [Candidatus Kaiserbacteria bacterium]|nr:ribosome-associated translation inhibitor RaiA [Candidatus Kaiserbacteria bacterium]
MAYTTINYKATNAEVDGSLKDILEKKIETLEKFVNDSEEVLCEVTFEKLASQQQGSIYTIDVNYSVNGNLFHAKATCDSFEQSIDEVRDQLDKELRRANKKQESLAKRGGRRLKNLLRFGRGD